jgi:hypothetical protein
VTTSFGAFGVPPDAVSRAALVVGLALAAWSVRRARGAASPPFSDRAVLIALAAVAALLSAGYVAYYLRGGPRIIDATSYYLEARALSEGHVRIPIPAGLPSGSFRGRFLLAADDGRSLSVIFPPGYPAVLALGFLLRAPMLVGPFIAAALVVATFALTKRLFGDSAVARNAAVLSTVCAVLRYHTADTMSHGLAALLFATALWAALDDRRSGALLAGVAAGALVATRPVSGALCLALALAPGLGTKRSRMDRPFWILLGALPPLLAYLVEQRLATGVWLESSQARYYRLADAPLGCFRYGFGEGIGCRFEHGDFVRAHLQHGFGFVAALGTTLRRLKMHIADAGNVELFAPVLVYALVRAFRRREGRIAAAGVLGILVVYAPFYFDGNYPAGGARFYADVLPLEHALIAWALTGLRAAHFAAPVALVGFALHTVGDHRQLRARDGGRPMFEAAELDKAGVTRGLVFVTTDHGFNLGFDPRSLRADGVIVARRRRDEHDRALWNAVGRPNAYEYSFDLGAEHVPSLVRISFDEKPDRRFEAESEWPPLAVSQGSVEPVFPACASKGRGLWIEPLTAGTPAVVRFEAPVAPGLRQRIRVGWAGLGGPVDAHFALGGASFRLVSARAQGCGVAVGPELSPTGRDILEVTAGSGLGIDFVEFEAIP